MKNKKEIYTFNMNDEVVVKLTIAGMKMLEEYYSQFPEKIRPKITKIHKSTLWKMMSIFGKYFYNGLNKIPFENNIIQIRKRD